MKEQAGHKKRQVLKRSDVVFTIIVVAVLLVIWFFSLPKEAGRQVEIRQEGALLAALPLGEDTVYEVEGRYHNAFVIKNGEVFVSDTDCPNRQCARSGKISLVGESIVCAPNGVTATITGGEARTDGITG